MTIRFVVSSIVMLVLVWAHSAAANTRLAVFIVVDGDKTLSNNLTEVAISKLAEKPGRELLGLRELEDQLNELPEVKSDGLGRCLASSTCLSEVGAIAGTEDAVVGGVTRESDHYLLELALVDSKTGATRARFSREPPLDLDLLISAVQAGVSELVHDGEVAAGSPAPPALAASAPPSPHEHKSEANDRHRGREKPKSHAATYVAYGTAALAVIAFSAAAVTGTIGSATPQGQSRAEVQADLARREDYAALANGFLIAGAGLATVSAVTFAVAW